MLTRRCFTKACATAPLIGLMRKASEVNPPKRLKFVLRSGRIWSRGRELRDGTWSLAVGLYDCRRRLDGEMRYRHFHASEHFVSMLRRHGASVKRSCVQPVLLAASAVLHHGPVGSATGADCAGERPMQTLRRSKAENVGRVHNAVAGRKPSSR